MLASVPGVPESFEHPNFQRGRERNSLSLQLVLSSVGVPSQNKESIDFWNT